MKRKSLLSAGFIFFSCFFLANNSFADKPVDGIGQWLQEVGVSVSYTEAGLKRQKDMTTFPLSLTLGFDLKPWAEKFGIRTKGLLELLYEPFLGYVSGPESDVELGLPVSFKYGFPLTEKLFPYVQAGIGPYYTSLHTYEQGSQFNFVSLGGGGLIYFFKDHWALNAGYRWRHLSNAGIQKPNAGIDAHEYTLGLSYYY